MSRVSLSVNLPDWLHGLLRKAKHAAAGSRQAPVIDLSGDREIEYSFIASRLPSGPGQALDFGSGFGTLSIHAIQRGWCVTGVDLMPYPIRWKNERFKFVLGDFLTLPFDKESFDVILNCSSVEHVGLGDRYGKIPVLEDGDLQAMEKLRSLLKAGGSMLLTIPAGRDSVIGMLHRVYGRNRLPKLIAGFEVREQAYWVKGEDNSWVSCNRDSALDYTPTGDGSDPTRCSYALACFVLGKPHIET